MKVRSQALHILSLLLVLCLVPPLTQGFVVRTTSLHRTSYVDYRSIQTYRPPTILGASGDDDTLTTKQWDEIVLGVAGTGAALTMIYSEYVLSQTGCGLPAGPFGLVGAIEGISYLAVVGLGSYSIYKKITTGSGLQEGKYGLLGLAEGLAFLALFAGAFVLSLQITNFGYIPNAVPMEGGMCS